MQIIEIHASEFFFFKKIFQSNLLSNGDGAKIANNKWATHCFFFSIHYIFNHIFVLAVN